MSDPVNSLAPRRPSDALCGRLRPELYRFAFWLARDQAVAEDVVQDTLMRAWCSFDALEDAAAAKRWPWTTVRREFARRCERKRLETVDIDDPTVAADPALASGEAQEVLEIRAAILALDDEYREPLVLQVLMGFTTREIATQLGLTQGAVLTRLFRARQKLKVAVTGREAGA